MNKNKVILSLLFIVLNSSMVFGGSLLAETKLICMNADKSVDLQGQKIESARQSMDGYMKMLAIKSFKSPQSVYDPAKVMYFR